MKNSDNTGTAVFVSDGNNEDVKKIIFRFNKALVIKCAICAILGFASVFSDMRPFSLGMYTALFSVESWACFFVSGAIGLFLSSGSEAWIYVASMIMTTVVLAVLEGKDSLYRRCIVCSVFLAVFKIAYISVVSLTGYDIMAVVLECIILSGSVITAYYGYSVFAGAAGRRFISSAEKLCTFTFTSFVLIALGNLEIFNRVNLSSVAAVLCIYILCMGAGIENATVFGTVAGVVTAMNTHPTVDVAGMYAFGALMASVFSKYRKTGIVFGFVLASTTFSLLISDFSRIYSAIAECLTASVIFIMIPEKVIIRFSTLFSKSDNVYAGSTLEQKIRADDFASLRKMSESFRELSHIYIDCARDKSIGRGYVISKMNYVSKKVCSFCPIQSKCFDSETERGTERAVALFEKTIKNGKLNIQSLPYPMKDICHRKDSFVEVFNSMLEIVKTENIWLGKINESRRLIGDQLVGVADSIDRICNGENMRVNPLLEENLKADLDKNGVFAMSVRAYTDLKGDFNIYVGFRDGYVPRDAKNRIAACIDRAVYTKSRFVSSSKEGNEKTFLFCPQRKYVASFGYASKAKHGEKLSGDSFNIITPDKKSVVMALSDGMGHGMTAKNESKTAINLLEKFLVAGFDSDSSVRLINSSLLLKSSRDSFATIDICRFDLNDHTLVFTKLGAANTYIRTDDGVSVVRGKNLPAGILREIEIEKHMISVDSDTVIVMVSDGVGDTAIKKEECEMWIENMLLQLDTRNPQIIAAKILEYAYNLENKQPSDDMTVLVGCISDSEEQVYSSKTGTY